MQTHYSGKKWTTSNSTNGEHTSSPMESSIQIGKLGTRLEKKCEIFLSRIWDSKRKDSKVDKCHRLPKPKGEIGVILETEGSIQKIQKGHFLKKSTPNFTYPQVLKPLYNCFHKKKIFEKNKPLRAASRSLTKITHVKKPVNHHSRPNLKSSSL